MKKHEWMIIAVIAALSLGMILLMNSGLLGRGASSENEPEYEAKGEWIGLIHHSKIIFYFDSGVDANYEFEGDVGLMKLEVKDGKWHVTYVDCPNHICEMRGWVDENTSIADSIYCVPNDFLFLPKDTAKMVVEAMGGG